MKHLSTLVYAVALLGALSPELVAQQSSRYRPKTPTPPVRDSRQAAISQEVNCLRQTASGLSHVFNDHLRTRRPRPTSSEIELQEALTELNEDVEHFVKDLQSNSDLAHLYRTFHMLEYSMQEAWALAGQAGYSRSLSQWLSDADGHVANLANFGFRNPRLQPIEIEQHIHSSSRSTAQNDYVFAPPVPQPPPGRGVPQQPTNGNTSRPGEVRIDLGDALRRIFGQRGQ